MHFCVLKLPASAQKSAICSLADDYRTIECIQSEQKFVSSFPLFISNAIIYMAMSNYVITRKEIPLRVLLYNVT